VQGREPGQHRAGDEGEWRSMPKEFIYELASFLGVSMWAGMIRVRCFTTGGRMNGQHRTQDGFFFLQKFRYYAGDYIIRRIRFFFCTRGVIQ
jgi:hypothetical protein